MSLVKGAQMKLKAVGVSVKPGGEVEELVIGGTVSTRGEGIDAVEIDGVVKQARVGGVEAHGADARRVRVGDDATCPAGLEAFRD
ncbi:hypothetical protein KW076_07660 [Micrococcus porci]|uniref:hypothetical protein n=1 Tax=Micrococcus TaxID=1269 RepID=UPI001CC936DA|nr:MULTISPECIES: hypothetical protein [Micrococcus]MCG7421978.1 hypothetical protein [Micrococcus sp. ACRRV]UBH23777.1 hypothetical protein KW076_07660 [Micrococcus porci]